MARRTEQAAVGNPYGVKPTKAARDEFAKRVGSTKGQSIAVETAEQADAWLAALVTATYGAEASLEPADAAHPIAVMADRGFPIDHFGTYTLKVPNPNMISDRPMFFGGPEPETPGVFGTQNMRRSFTGIGNATHSPAYRVMSAVYMTADGRSQSVLDDLISNGPIAQALRRLAANNSAVNAIIKAAEEIAARRQGGCDAGEVDPGNKVILWPTGGDDYVAITPVTNTALLAELKERIDARLVVGGERTDVFFPDRAMKVGGTKPQNAGIAVSDRGGWFRLLRCEPPPIRERDETLSKLREDFAAMEKLRDLPGIKRVRDMRDRRIARIVRRVGAFLRERNLPCAKAQMMDLIRRRAPFTLNDFETRCFAERIELYERETA